MKFSKQTTSGAWLKGADVVSGTKAKIVEETVSQEREFEGKVRKQNVTKVLLQGENEAKNCNVNTPSLNALIDALGGESGDWIGKIVTLHTEKMVVGGRRVTALYLVPEGYEVSEDTNGYVIVAPTGKKEEIPVIEEEELDPKTIPF